MADTQRKIMLKNIRRQMNFKVIISLISINNNVDISITFRRCTHIFIFSLFYGKDHEQSKIKMKKKTFLVVHTMLISVKVNMAEMKSVILPKRANSCSFNLIHIKHYIIMFQLPSYIPFHQESVQLHQHSTMQPPKQKINTVIIVTMVN